MKAFQLRTALCAIAILFTFAAGAQNLSTSKSDTKTSYIIGGKQQHKKNHKGNSARSKKKDKGHHCDAY